MKILKSSAKRNAEIVQTEHRELSEKELLIVSGGIAESPPPAHDTLVRPGDTRGTAL